MSQLTNIFDLIDDKIPVNPPSPTKVDAADVNAVLKAIAASAMGQTDITVQTALAANSVTDMRLIGKSVSLIVGSGYSMTLDDFTQPDNTGTLTLINGNAFAGGAAQIFFS